MEPIELGLASVETKGFALVNTAADPLPQKGPFYDRVNPENHSTI